MTELQAAPAGAAEAGKRCAICQSALAAGDPCVRCSACDAPYHDDCWSENGGCATYGCELMPETVKEPDPAIPQAHWGQEFMPCPSCGKDVRVAAKKCRHCRAAISADAPRSRREAAVRARDDRRKHATKQTAWTLFVAGVLPCTAPFTLLLGGPWYLARREQVAALPATERAVCMIGLIASAVSTTLMLFALAVYR